MSDKLHFSLVSPARELYAGEVDQVIAPGTDGEFGVLPAHAPFMTTLKIGRVRIIDGTTIHRYFVRGGFADVTPDGLTILAEEALPLADLNATEIETQLKEEREKLSSVSDSDSLRDLHNGNVARLEALLEALQEAE